jgi:hypothetical protein
MEKEIKKKLPKQKEEPEVEKVVSPRRVLIATILGIIIAGAFLWLLSQFAQKVIDFTTSPVVVTNTNPSTSVKILEKGDATQVLGDTKKNITEMTFDEYLATGSAVRNVLDTLQNLQKSEVGIEDYFCKIFCQ